MTQYQTAFVVDPETGNELFEFGYPEGKYRDQLFKAIGNPAPGQRVEVRIVTKPDGYRVMQVGKFKTDSKAPASDDLDSASLRDLVTTAQREGFGRNGLPALTMQMPADEIRSHIRKNRLAKLAPKKTAPAKDDKTSEVPAPAANP